MKPKVIKADVFFIYRNRHYKDGKKKMDMKNKGMKRRKTKVKNYWYIHHIVMDTWGYIVIYDYAYLTSNIYTCIYIYFFKDVPV